MPSKADVFARYADQLQVESDRGAVLVAAALLDAALEKAIRARLVDPYRGNDRLFDVPNAPLQSFSSKIEMAFRIGIIVEGMAKALHIFRKIRNDCAHSSDYYTFADKNVFERIRSLMFKNKDLYKWIKGPEAPRDQEVNEGWIAKTLTLRNEFELYFAYLAMSIWERSQMIDQITFHKEES